MLQRKQRREQRNAGNEKAPVRAPPERPPPRGRPSSSQLPTFHGVHEGGSSISVSAVGDSRDPVERATNEMQEGNAAGGKCAWPGKRRGNVALILGGGALKELRVY